MSVTRKIYQKDENGNFIEVADIGALAQYILFEELNDKNEPATAIEIVARLRKELADAITTEATTRATNDTAEETARKAKDDELQAAISKEASDRTTAVSGEKTARESADLTLQTNIDTEKTARETGDTNTLNSANLYTDGKITQEVTDRNAAIKVETDARTAAITKEVSDRNSAISTAISNAVGANGAIMTELKNTNSTLYKEIVKIAKAQMTT